MDQKNFIKVELDKQIAEKKKLKVQEKLQEGMFHKSLMEQLDQKNKEESEKQHSIHSKILAEKTLRDKQITADMDRRNNIKLDEERGDKDAVKKLEDEIQKEKAMEQTRRLQDKA